MKILQVYRCQNILETTHLDVVRRWQCVGTVLEFNPVILEIYFAEDKHTHDPTTYCVHVVGKSPVLPRTLECDKLERNNLVKFTILRVVIVEILILVEVCWN